jgi:hypothetical protein
MRVKRVVAAVDCGLVINPIGVEQQIEGGIIWGLSSVLKGEITFRNGAVEQESYDDFEVARMSDAPTIETHIVQSETARPYGMGEPPSRRSLLRSQAQSSRRLGNGFASCRFGRRICRPNEFRLRRKSPAPAPRRA